MTSIRKVALACMTAAMVTISVNAGAQTGPANQDTFFTFSQSVELPKTTLPAGTYFFQLMDSPSNRHIVKVMSQDRKQLLATLMAIPFYSNDRPSDKPEVRFMETPAAAGTQSANAIKIWFYPGNTTGHEFIYPRSQALKIAARTGETVLTTKTESEESELSRVNANGDDAEASLNTAEKSETPVTQTASAEPQREPVGAITGSPEPAPAPEPAATPAPAPAPERTEAPAPRTNLPHTAGFLPLLGLMGLGSLAGSRMMRRARQ
jgi:hypothetical protein